MENSSPGPAPGWKLTTLLFFLCFFTYLPALDNGFISDDYVILERVEALKNDWGYLFQIPPENFRLTSYLVFAVLKASFGYSYEYFYLFTICVHFLNSLLLWKLLLLVTQERKTSALAAILFAVFQNPQETVMWLTAMHEALLGGFVLITLILWVRQRFGWSLVFYCLALFSKESALVVPLLIPLLQFQLGKKLVPRQCYYFLFPTIAFLALLIYTWSTNSLIQGGLYDLGPYAVVVLAKSLHRLLWPWMYLVLFLFWAQRRQWPSAEELGKGLLWMAVPLLPYLGLVYQSHVPSRHEHLASMAFAALLAALLLRFNSTRIQLAFVVAFTVFNLAYIWIRKDSQFEERASSTTQLVAELRNHPPSPLVVLNFPQNPWIGKLTTRLVDGWEPDMLVVSDPSKTCASCRKLYWDSDQRRYVELAP